MHILVIRHGESEWNAQGRWQGQADPPLTLAGRRQAQIASDAVQALHDAMRFDLVVASDLARAHDTARIIAAAIDMAVDTEPAFRERHAGPWQGLTRVEINEKWPGAIGAREWPEGYELDHSVMDRVIPALRDVASRSSRALIVAHGGVIRALDRVSGAPDEAIPNLAGRWYGVGRDITPGERHEFVPNGIVQEVE